MTVDERIKPGIRLALRLHEIGNQSPYQLSFAGKGRSGASFGFMQGDLAANQPVVTATFEHALTAAGFSADEVNVITRELSAHLTHCPLTPNERDRVNAALLASKALVDLMDETILRGVYADLGKCLDSATAANRSIAAKALIYMAMWINMTGPPTTLLKWLGGAAVQMHRTVAPPGSVVDGAVVETYLRATDYYSANPQNFLHLETCAAAGAAIV